jgi:hypothetical protein
MMNEKKECSKCKGIGWLRKELDVFDEGFGRLVRCECNIEDVIIQDPEPEDEPEVTQEDFGWEDYTNYD